jgi:hypothetical protein
MEVDFKDSNRKYVYLKLKDGLPSKLIGLEVIVKSKTDGVLHKGVIKSYDAYHVTKTYNNHNDGYNLVFVDGYLYYVDIDEESFLAKVI